MHIYAYLCILSVQSFRHEAQEHLQDEKQRLEIASSLYEAMNLKGRMVRMWMV